MSDCSNRADPCLVISPPVQRGASSASCCSYSISIRKQLHCQEEQDIVGHISVLSTPPLIDSSWILEHLALSHIPPPKYCSENLLSSQVLPPHIVYSMLQRGLLSIDLAVKAYRLVCLHRLSLKSWFLIHPPLQQLQQGATPSVEYIRPLCGLLQFPV